MQDVSEKRLPQHIAIIMDGNGRWAKKHKKKRIEGHRRGAEAVRIVVRACRELGIPYLTLFAFSTENWLRPYEEVSGLMRLLKQYIQSEIDELSKNDIRLNVIGDLSSLKKSVRRALEDAMKKTENNRSMVLNLALSYGGRDEIVMAARRLIQDAKEGLISPDEVDDETFSRYLYTAGIPDPDLLIRTSGEFRISNFLLWQCAYTEFYFTDVFWPDFTKEDLLAAISEYQRRERRFGRTSDQL
ncbi:MAG: isoprenyl transferase [Syntrophales bacterium]|nr:isoprenyl transferase [Syntrophales bacterium]